MKSKHEVKISEIVPVIDRVISCQYDVMYNDYNWSTS